MNILKSAKSHARHFLDFSSQTYRKVTSPVRLMPDFLIIGGQRCGTTSLYYYLLDHPTIFSAYTKEIHFFDENFTKGLHWYRAQFPTTIQKCYIELARKGFITGEASASYLFHPRVPKRISASMPQVKLIVLLRNPIDRAYSQHWFNLTTHKGFETLSFKDAIQCEEERLAGERERIVADENYSDLNYRRFSYLARGIYVDQLQYWLNFYPGEQFLILRSEDLYNDPAGTVKQTLEFLGVPGTEIHSNKEYKPYRVPTKTGYKVKNTSSKMDPDLRNYLIDYFRPHNARLSKFLGRDFGWDK